MKHLHISSRCSHCWQWPRWSFGGVRSQGVGSIMSLMVVFWLFEPWFCLRWFFILGLTKVPFGEYFLFFIFSRVLKQIQGTYWVAHLVYLCMFQEAVSLWWRRTTSFGRILWSLAWWVGPPGNRSSGQTRQEGHSRNRLLVFQSPCLNRNRSMKCY